MSLPSRTRTWPWAGILMLFVASASLADDPPAASPPATPSAIPAATSATTDPRVGEARLKFDAIFSRWKDQLKILRDQRVRFTVVEDRDLAAVREQFLSTLATTEAMIPELRDAAIAAYREAPDQDRELTRFLLKLVEDDVQHDRYETALLIAKSLLDAGSQDKALYDLAGASAFSLEDFELAEKYLQEAHDLGVLDKSRELYSQLPEMKAGWEREKRLRAAEAQANDLPRVKLVTSKGDIILELFENEAPDTVGNFISLVEKGFYNGLTFHRVIPGFMAQGGCPRGDGQGGPNYRIYCECYREDHREHFRGSLSMAKEKERNTGGSQFFITFRPTPHLNGLHTVFGRVVEGFDVLAKLQRRDPADAQLAQTTPDRIEKAEVLRKRDHAYQPNKVSEAGETPPPK